MDVLVAQAQEPAGQMLCLSSIILIPLQAEKLN
jgi:hypothetical protein